MAVPSKNRHLGKKSQMVLAALRTVAEKIPRLDSQDKHGNRVGEVSYRSVGKGHLDRHTSGVTKEVEIIMRKK